MQSVREIGVIPTALKAPTLKMKKLHLLHLFDGLFTGSKHKMPKAVSYTKALPATCLVWSSRNLNNVHGYKGDHGITWYWEDPLHQPTA